MKNSLKKVFIFCNTSIECLVFMFLNKCFISAKSWHLVEIRKFGRNPEIWLKSWNLFEILKLGHQNEPLAHVTKCSLQVAPLALDPSLVIRWRHLHLIPIWSSGGATCIATLPGIVLLSLSASIELVSSSARVTSVKSAKGLWVSQLERLGPIDRTPGIPGSDKKGRKKLIFPHFWHTHVYIN